MTEPLLSGILTEKEHRLSLRVYYADTDAGGVVYHASYLAFAERARTEMMRLIGVDLPTLKDEKHLVFAVRRCEIDFLRPARLDDLLDVRTVLRSIGGAHLDMVQSIWRGGEELARLALTLVCTLEAARAARMPATLRDVLQGFVKETD